MQFQLPNGQMFDTENPCCPTCGGEMWDNRNNKKNPKQPDFRCKDQECKGDKGYQTGVYLPKAKGKAPAPAPAKPVPAQTAKPAAAPVARPVTPTPAPVQKSGGKGDYGNTVPPSMYGAWAMNLVVALVAKDKVTSVAEGIAAYKEALKGVGETIEENKKTLDARTPLPPAQQERQVAKPAPAAPVAETPQAASEPLPDPLQQIEQDLGTAGVDEISAEDLSNLDL
jgi:hypothetical protein